MSRQISYFSVAGTLGMIIDNQNATSAMLFLIRAHKADLKTKAVGACEALQGVHCRALPASLQPGDGRLGGAHAGCDFGLGQSGSSPQLGKSRGKLWCT